MSCQELQEEELEVLQAIYEGDEAFKETKPTTFQYKVGEDQHYKSFLLEIKWGDAYPGELPNINLNAFYNKHISPEVKAHVISKLKEQAGDLLDNAMTYTLFDWAKENADELMIDQLDTPQRVQVDGSSIIANEPAKPKQKKEQLTKSQKRKIGNRLDNKGEMPRGHDWVDVVKHLSQTGKGAEKS